MALVPGIFLFWFRREALEREQPDAHSNDEFEAYVVRRQLADILDGAASGRHSRVRNPYAKPRSSKGALLSRPSAIIDELNKAGLC